MSKPTDPISQAYKTSMTQITKSLSQLDLFTNNLETKVDGILKAQETQFVNSYKVHMHKLKEEFDRLGGELKKRDLVIEEYENQGKMANLMKRVAFLEGKNKKLLTDLEKKNDHIRELLLDGSIKNSEIKRLQQKVKQLLRQRASMGQKVDRQASYQSIPTFTTEIAQQNTNSKGRLSKMVTQEKSLKLRSLHQRSQKSQISINPEVINQTGRLQRQLSQLKKQNRQLLIFNSRFISQTTATQKFFIETVNQIKRNIAIRKQVKQCSLQQFRKQDKLELLIKVLSNDQITMKLYSLIFGKKDNPFMTESLSIQRPMSLRNKLNSKKSAQYYHFPSIQSARLS